MCLVDQYVEVVSVLFAAVDPVQVVEVGETFLVAKVGLDLSEGDHVGVLSWIDQAEIILAVAFGPGEAGLPVQALIEGLMTVD